VISISIDIEAALTTPAAGYDDALREQVTGASNVGRSATAIARDPCPIGSAGASAIEAARTRRAGTPDIDDKPFARCNGYRRMNARTEAAGRI
jgi:hypothetical protein